MAGQAVRVVEIPADAGAGLGIFDQLHGFAGGAELAEHLRLAADRQCGHAGRAFLERLTAPTTRSAASSSTRRGRRSSPSSARPDADGQVKRVCGRFALVAAAGELATWLGVLPWAQGEAEDAAVRCFDDWLRHRGGTVPAEIVAGMRQVRLFLEQHGSSRFEPAWLTDDHRQFGRRGGRGVDPADHQPGRVPAGRRRGQLDLLRAAGVLGGRGLQGLRSPGGREGAGGPEAPLARRARQAPKEAAGAGHGGAGSCVRGPAHLMEDDALH